MDISEPEKSIKSKPKLPPPNSEWVHKKKRGAYKTKAEKTEVRLARQERRKVRDMEKSIVGAKEKVKVEAKSLKAILEDKGLYRRVASLMASGKYTDGMIARAVGISTRQIPRLKLIPEFMEIYELYSGVGDSIRHDIELLSLDLSTMALKAYQDELLRTEDDPNYNPDRKLKAAKDILSVSGSNISERSQKVVPTNQTNIQINVEEAQRAIDVMGELIPNKTIVHRDCKEVVYEPSS